MGALAALLIFICSILSCASDKAPPGRIVVKNDTRDREYNVIEVSAPGTSARLKPGEKVTLAKDALNFTVSRAYKDYTRSYSVECPPLKEKGIFIKLIDIHVNRIAGKCVTVQAGKD